MPHKEYAMAYLDDILIFSASETDHQLHIEKVLQSIRKANLKINYEKCNFALNEVGYLGFRVSSEGIKPDPCKIDKVKEFPVPKNCKELKSFLGLANYYRQFIKNFAKTAEPLNKLTRKGVMFLWTAEQNTAFLKLKDVLTEAPVLAYPDFSRDFLLFTDASDYAAGAILSQCYGDYERVISYASTTFNVAQRNYATVEKECLAIVWAVHHFKPYLYGRRFKVVSDHAPLRWLMRNKSTSSRLTRFALKLQDFNIQDVEYRPGSCNANADALSRISSAVTRVVESVKSKVADHPGCQLDNFRMHQNSLKGSC